MKKLVFISCLVLIQVSAFSQQSFLVKNQKYNFELNNKISNFYPTEKAMTLDISQINRPGERMKKTGIGLTIPGVALTGLGVWMMSTASALYYSSTTNQYGQTVEEGDPKGGFGVLVTALGVGMSVPGVILWTIGGSKLKRYKEEHP